MKLLKSWKKKKVQKILHNVTRTTVSQNNTVRSSICRWITMSFDVVHGLSNWLTRNVLYAASWHNSVRVILFWFQQVHEMRHTLSCQFAAYNVQLVEIKIKRKTLFRCVFESNVHLRVYITAERRSPLHFECTRIARYCNYPKGQSSPRGNGPSEVAWNKNDKM
jgi:hypothetical protein